MIRIDDIWNYQMLIGAKETIDNLRSDVRLAKHIEGRDQETQGNVSDNEMQHLKQLNDARDPVRSMSRSHTDHSQMYE